MKCGELLRLSNVTNRLGLGYVWKAIWSTIIKWSEGSPSDLTHDNFLKYWLGEKYSEKQVNEFVSNVDSRFQSNQDHRDIYIVELNTVRATANYHADSS